MNNITLSLMTGIDIPFVEIQANIHQPKIIEIAYMGEEEFFSAVQFLCISKDKFEKNQHIKAMTNLELLFSVIENSERKIEKLNDIKNLLLLMFPDYTIILSKRSIILKQRETQALTMIDNTNFDAFQEIVKRMFCLDNSITSKNTYNPSTKLAKKIADKLMEGRKKVAEQKGEKNSSLIATYLSILSIGLHIGIEELSRLTIFQLYDLIERFQLYSTWDIHNKIRLAGGTVDNKEEDEHWMKNLH